MKPERKAFCALVFAVLGLGLYSQSPGLGTGTTDVILLLDTSSGMAASYNQVNNYITGSFLREFVRIGDTFHLITFSDTSKLDIARRVLGRGDIEVIIGRMFLHYPLGPQANYAAALSFAEQYTASLPARPKKIVMVSAGNYSGVGDGFDMDKTRSQLARHNASFDFVQVSLSGGITNLPTSGRGQPRAAVPPAPSTPVRQEVPVPPPPDSNSSPLQQAQEERTSEIVSAAATEEAPIPEMLEEPAKTDSFTNVYIDPVPDILLKIDPPEKQASRGNTVPLLLFLTGLGLMGIIIIGFFVITISKFRADRFNSNPILLNLYVEDQNVFIGRRNIHALNSVGKLTIGGGNSDFLIFVVPVPPRIAEIHRNGNHCTFVPLKAKYFPDLGSKKLTDCLGKTIHILTDKQYLLKIRFERRETEQPPQ